MKSIIYVCIVSHGHSSIINELNCASDLSSIENVKVIIKSNLPGDDFTDSKLTWFNERYNQGFGANNNFVYNKIKGNLKAGDVFIVMNPDIKITKEQFLELINLFFIRADKLSAINLFKDKGLTVFDNSIRKFPNLIDFFSSFFLSRNRTIINKTEIKDNMTVDWAAGSFLVFDAEHYNKLSGFDEKYFMYCEDIDICFRSKFLLGQEVVFYPNIKAYHAASHENRKICSKHFYWHLKSAIKFIYSKRKIFKSIENEKK
ncbi:glycosyltransferase family 2 protein [Vibrio vulnificus]|nr:glycosyltransferase family 2 protein [Vibrio vulnificus]EGQ7934011.1 glycosyltransferase family 2 protein [Vibrio vulnificus]